MAQRRKVVGDWILGSQLGRGSFAVVWQGQHRVTGATVAVKEINTNQLNAKLKQSLECEVSILKRVEHRNIVRLQETLEERNRMYLIMEFCAGGDLAHFIRCCRRVPEAIAHGLMLQLAAGLREMWSHNLVHRDLKPQNLLLSDSTPNAVLKIADFGFARNLQPQGMAETLCGSPLYMAPEILHFQRYDAKADLWSVGTILFELLTGRPPFHGDNHVQLLHNIERHPPRIPTDLNLSSPCRRLLSGLLKRNPVERISFEEFFSDPWLTTAGGPAAAPGPADAAVERSAGSGTRPAGSSGASTGTGLAGDLLPFMIDDGEDASGSTGASRPVPVSDSGGGHGAPLLMSSTRLDVLIGPLTPSVTDTSLARMATGSRGSSTSGVGRRHGPPAAGSAADTMDEDDYVIIDGSSIGVRAAAALAHQQPPSPSSLAALRRRGLAAMWHPLSPSPTPPSTRVSAARPPPSPRSAAAAQQQAHRQQHSNGSQQHSPEPDLFSHQRRPSADSSASTATGPLAMGRAASAGCAAPGGAGAGGWAMSVFIGTAVGTAATAGQPHSQAEALEHVAGALESLAASATRQDHPSRGLALRLLALQLLQLALVADRQPAGAATIAVAADTPAQQEAAQQQAAQQVAQLGRASSAPATDSPGSRPAAAAVVASVSAAGQLAPRLSAALHAVSGAAQRAAMALAHAGGAGADLPDAWEAAYEGGLELSQAAAAEELLGNLRAAAHAYAKAVAIMHFIGGEAARLPLQPTLELTAQQQVRVQRYAAAISARLAAVSAQMQQQAPGGCAAGGAQQ